MMTLLWSMPALAAAAGVVIVLVQLARMADAASELALQVRRLEEVRVAVVEVRAATAVTAGFQPSRFARRR